MRIGLIGSGNIGSTIARLALDAGHDVVVSNSRGPDTLRELVVALGDGATAGTAEDAAAAGALVVVSIPFKNFRDVPVEPLAGKIVIDTGNYYPPRDGQVARIDDGSSTESELLAEQLPQSRVVKAFNTLYYLDLATRGRPSGEPDRKALPIAGDDSDAKRQVAELIDAFGFDVVDVGPLEAGRRFGPGTAAYAKVLTADELRAALES